MIQKGYSDGPLGQVHWRRSGRSQPASHHDLYCLHPAPFSGRMFEFLLPYLSEDRRAIAPDYPGFGGSDPFKADALIGDYASAVEDVVTDLSDDHPVDLLGFHSGCLVAVELALRQRTAINKIILIDVPAFDPAKRAELLASTAAKPDVTDDMASLQKQWNLGYLPRWETLGKDWALRMFGDYVGAGTDMHATFHASFSYDVEDAFHRISCPVSIIATQSGLLEATRSAAKMIRDAHYVERLDITKSVLEGSAAAIAPTILEELS